MSVSRNNVARFEHRFVYDEIGMRKLEEIGYEAVGVAMTPDRMQILMKRPIAAEPEAKDDHVAHARNMICATCGGGGVTRLADVFNPPVVPCPDCSVCPTCGGSGEVDESLGGSPRSRLDAPCPDCSGGAP